MKRKTSIQDDKKTNITFVLKLKKGYICLYITNMLV